MNNKMSGSYAGDLVSFLSPLVKGLSMKLF